MADIPSIEPSSLTAGDTVKWTRSLSDYPAPTWVLKYRLINAAGKIDITASASGSDHLVNVSAATSAGWTSGTYSWQAYVEGGSSERYTVGTGTLEIKRNWAAEAAGYDTRSNARTILEQLEQAYEDYCSNGQGLVQRYTIGGREMWFKSSVDFIKAIEYWRNQANTERAAEQVALGLGNPRHFYVRFN